MTRVYVVVEGQTEESFVNKVLATVFWARDIYLIPILLGKTGGRPSYARLKRDVVVLLKQDRTAYCSTMLDFYGLGEGFPGMPLPPNLQNIEKVTKVEHAVEADIVAHMGDNLRPDTRFVAYLQLHEYEGLLFSDPTAFASGIGQPHLAGQFRTIRSNFVTPEDINDNPKQPRPNVSSTYTLLIARWWTERWQRVLSD